MHETTGADGGDAGTPSTALQGGVEGVETLEALGQDLLVAQPHPRPAFEKPVEAETFKALKPAVLEVGVVDHLTGLLQRRVAQVEPLEQGLESAVLPMVAELRSGNVVGNRPGRPGRARAEYESGLGIDEPLDQP